MSAKTFMPPWRVWIWPYNTLILALRICSPGDSLTLKFSLLFLLRPLRLLSPIITNMFQQLQEQVKCPICVEDFCLPVTIHCGHTFCRECLRKSPSRECPLCRKPIISLIEHLQETDTISEMVKLVKNHKKGEPVNQILVEEQEIEEKLQSRESVQMCGLQLVNTSSQSLLLPFCRSSINIRCNSIQLPASLKNVVLEQQGIQRKYSILGNLINISPDINIMFQFECVFEGISFFEVTKIYAEEQEGQQIQICSGMAIRETTSLKMENFNQFFDIYDRISEDFKAPMASLLSLEWFMYRNNSLAVLYSIYILLAIPDHEKYTVLTSFSDRSRLKTLEEYFSNISVAAAVRNPPTVFRIPVPGNSSSIYMFALVFVLLVIWKLNN